VTWVNSGVVTRRAWLSFGFNDSIGGIHFGHSLLSMKSKVNPTTNQSGLKKHLASNLPIFSDFFSGYANQNMDTEERRSTKL
jgi:hypothetical protein